MTRWEAIPRRLGFAVPLICLGCLAAACDEAGTEPPDDDAGVCGTAETLELGLEPAAEIHVAIEGDDADGDGSASAPYASLARAAQDAGPGGAIRIGPGDYAGGTFLAELRGTAAAPIWIGGVDGEARPRLSGGGEGLHLSSVSYLVVHDIEVAGASQNGINTDDSGDVDDAAATHHVVFRGLWIHDIGGTGNQDCLKLSGINQYWVLDSVFERCGGGGSGSGVDHVGADDGLLLGNTFREMSANAIQVKGGSENIEIRGNRIVEGGARALNLGGSTGDQFFRPPLSAGDPNVEARDVRAIANIIEGATASIAFVGCVDCLAAHNTIINPTRWIFRILQETTTHAGFEFLPARDGVVANNLVYFERAALSTDVNVGPDTDAESFRFEANLWYAWDDPAASAPELPGTELGSITSADPAFAADYRIPAASPAAGAGVLLTGVSADFAGACYLDPPSIGAREVAGG